MFQKQAGPVEVRLAASDRDKLRDLCQLDNHQLMALMDQIIEHAEPDGYDFDEELFTAAQQLLNERTPIDHHVDPEEMLGRFFTRYESLLEKPIQASHAVPHLPQYGHRHRHFLRRLLVVAALLIMIGSVYALATGKNPITESINLGEQLVQSIRYGQSGQLELPATETGYHTLEEAYDQVGVTAMSLQWIPAGFDLKRISVIQDHGAFLSVDAYFEGNNEAMLFHIAPIDDDWYLYDEKESIPPEIIKDHGQAFKVYDNNGWLGIRWTHNSIAYLLTGNITRDEATHIIATLKFEE